MLSLRSWKLPIPNLQRIDANCVFKPAGTFCNGQEVSFVKDTLQISGNFDSEKCVPYSNKFIPSTLSYNVQEKICFEYSQTNKSLFKYSLLNKPVLSSLRRQLHTQSLVPHHLLSSQSQSSIRNYCSALFITNDKLAQLNSHVTPTFDIGHVLNNKENVIDNLTRRKLNTREFDFSQMQSKYTEFVRIEKIITEFEHKLIELEQYLLENKGKLGEEQVQAKYAERRELKAETRKFNDFLLDFQKTVVVKVLQLPNELDPMTPEEYETISEFTPEGNVKQASMETLDKYVRYTNRLDVHYLGDAAKFEYLSPIVLKNYFCTNHNFIPFTNTDLAKGVIVEGCGTPYLCPYNNIVLVNNELQPQDIGHDERRFHLVGGGAMEMFCAFHTNHSVSVKDLPVQYVASGKRYGFQNLICNMKKDTNTNEDVQNISHLYNSLQKESINLFIATDGREKLRLLFNNMQTILEPVIRVLNIPYRVCRTPASHLHPSEALRIEFQVYSSQLKSWVTCMDVCMNNDYISKRLTMCHHSSVTSYDRHYLNIINANVYLNVLLINLIEHGGKLDVNVLSNSLKKINNRPEW
uniref:Serine--tRNA ligase, mitochondrial n=1 Tax=Cacopsylla melanoneura TaxID=428564 RepID=A0A8D9AXC0_9HEMI